jgi:hypothetical protein
MTVSQSIAFNAESQSWESYANYTEAPYENRQMWLKHSIIWIHNSGIVLTIIFLCNCQSSSFYVPNYGIEFYGGTET